MKKYILSLMILFCSITGFAQTQPNKPSGAVPYGSVWITPNGHVWTGSAIVGYTNLGNKNYVDALVALGYTKTQVDAIVQAAKEFSTSRSNHTGTQEIETVANLPESLASKIPLTEKGVSNGVSTLDPNGKIPLLQIPDALIGSVNYQGNWNPSTNIPALPATPAASTKGHYYIASTTGTFNGVEYNNGDWIISNGAAWGKVDNTNKVVSVNGKQGSVVLSLADFAGGSDLVTLSTAQNITAKKTFQTPDATTGNAISPIEVKGGNGAGTAGTSGVAAAGNAGDLKITTGSGGTSTGVNPSGTNIGGKGGQINITAGNGGIATGAGTNIPGSGGNVVVQAGTAFNSGVPGRVEIKAGNNDNGVGGDIYLTTGYGSGGPDSDVNAGNIYMAMSASNNIRGNVLIGGNSTQNNGNKLQVYGKASVSQAPTAPTDVVRLSDLQGSISSETLQSVALRGNTYTSQSPYFRFEKSGVLNWFFGNIGATGYENNFSIHADNASSSPFIIQSGTGNVGIGMTNPQYKLHVNGEFASYGADFGSRIRIFGSPEQPNSRRWFLQSNLNAWGDLGIFSQANNGTGDRYDFLIKENGSVGIGTLTPTAKLEVAGSIRSSDKNVLNILSYTGTSGVVGTESNHPLDIWTNSSSKMTILPNGNVGVGTTAPVTKLDVNGVVTATGGNSTQWNTAYTDGVTLTTNQQIVGRKIFRGGTGNAYNTSVIEIQGDGTANKYPTIGFHQPGINGTTLSVRHDGQMYFNDNRMWTTANFDPADYVNTSTNQNISGLKTFTQWTQSNQGFRSYATANSNAAYSPTGITFNTSANTYATIDANSSGGLIIRTADGSATAQPRMTFLTPSGATARSVMIAGRAYYNASYTGSFEANDLITKAYVDDKMQLITLRATISGGVAVLDGGTVASGYRYIVQGACLYNGSTPEFLSLSKLAIQAGTSGNVAVQYETTSVDNGKDVEVLILKIKQ